MKLKPGKIPDDELSKILGKYTNANDESVILGPKIGEDAAIVRMASEYLAICTDPILVGIKNPAYYAVAININDLVTRGAIPRWASACVFFPVGSTLQDVDEFFQQLYKAVKQYEVNVVTGHTEITSAVKNPGVVITMFGEICNGRYITTGGAQEGDSLILTGGAGIEGTSIIANDLYDSIKGKVDDETVKRAKNFIFEPGICIAEAARIAWKYHPNALHDPTEGGIRKGIDEMAVASDKGILVDYDKIPIREETRRVCDATGHDPLAIFGSGSLLISISPGSAKLLMEQYKENNIVAGEIGKVVAKEQGRMLLCNGKKIPLEASHTDGLMEALNRQ
jgi:hydrogenase maturation factor